MSDLMVFNAVKMNSLEIAELTGSDHKDIKRSIYRLIKKGIIQNSPMAKVENKQSLSPNRFSDVYVFEGERGKRDSIIVVAQNCPEFTARLVDRWQELEKQVRQPALPDFTDPVAAARAWADEVEQKRLVQKEADRLALENKELAPKAAVYNAIAKNEQHRNATQVAKPLGMTATQLNKKLEQVDVYDTRIKRGGRMFKQWFVDKGYGVVKCSAEGYVQSLFTAKGQLWVSELFACK
ncbi:DNA-binding protein [Escherichia coli]|uniref:phage antirepressor KilAC domain-containing protein n=1 Tax=Escherichia coli TaxID=562 RepID=UPI00130358F0|nr:phage antirepressor KilAC domain-containing protein [Escherichia coli]KAE9928286.1 DNA-binding protein [Escherichia coli]